MDFVQKREISRRIADPARIDVYRQLLAARRVPSSGMKGDDKRKLAVDLVFLALSHYSEHDILSACSSPSTGPVPAVNEKTEPRIPEEVFRKHSKFEEYPRVRWQDMDNPLVRTADAIFSDRINIHQKLRAMEPQLDATEVGSDLLKEFVDLTIRMELCFRELKTFNDRGEFYGQHPFIAQRTERERLTELLRTDPSRFMEEMHNVEGNISRYRSHSKSSRLSAEKRAKEAENLVKYEALKKMYQEILESNIKR